MKMVLHGFRGAKKRLEERREGKDLWPIGGERGGDLYRTKQREGEGRKRQERYAVGGKKKKEEKAVSTHSMRGESLPEICT